MKLKTYWIVPFNDDPMLHPFWMYLEEPCYKDGRDMHPTFCHLINTLSP